MKITVALHCDGYHTKCPTVLSLTMEADHPDVQAACDVLAEYATRSNWRIRNANPTDPTASAQHHCPDCVTRDGRWAAKHASGLGKRNPGVILEGGI